MKVAFDIGGTFTDVIALRNDGRIKVVKRLSLLDTIGQEISRFVSEDESVEPVESFIHGTTTCSNALIERTIARVAFITTRGFRSMLEMMGQRGPLLPDLNWERPLPLVPADLCYVVNERVLADGSIDRPLDDGSLCEVIEELRSSGAEVVAICLINAYVNPVHEVMIKGAVEQEMSGIPVCASWEIDAEMEEYQRASTTVINASLIPVVRNYLDGLEAGLGHPRHLRIMQSNGGTMSSALAREKPMTMVESGPAAGVLAAATCARTLGLDNALSFDMGGTSAKACVIEGGVPLERLQVEVGGELGGVSANRVRGAGHPLRTPSLDISEVGAGGGSIAWIDIAGALRVGPRSAGADPGPVCYGRGGTLPTVTDANMVLGYINPHSIAGGGMLVDRLAAEEVIERVIAKPLGLGVYEAARGIIDVANATMMRAIRSVSTERGRDIRTLTMIAFGGAGPLHSVSLAEQVGIRQVVIPPVPGVFSALGLLLAGDRLDYVRSIEQRLDLMDPRTLIVAYNEMLSSAQKDLGEEVAGRSFDIDCSIDLRYSSEPQELNISLDVQKAFDAVDVERRFQEAHLRELGFEGEGRLQLARLRIRMMESKRPVSLEGLREDSSAGGSSFLAERRAYFGYPAKGVSTKVMRREDVSGPQSGPVIVEEDTTTVVIPPGWSVRRDDLNNLIIDNDVPG